MIAFVLDTDILTLSQEGHPTVIRNISKRSSSELAISIITVEEQLSGWYRRLRQVKTATQLARIYDRLTVNVTSLSRWQIVSFSEQSIQRYEQLRAMKLNIGKMDLRIAAVALENNAVLVSRNRADFQRVPGLVFEDWSTT